MKTFIPNQEWVGCPFEHCSYEGRESEVTEHLALRHEPTSPKWDGYPDLPDWWLREEGNHHE